MMGRRRLVVLVSALLMLGIAGGVVGAFVAATHSADGRDFIRRVLQAQLSRSMKGTVRLGTLGGSFITDLSIDSLEIRDPDDSIFAATGPIRVTFDPRDLMDGRLLIRTVDADRPRVHFRRGFDEKWNLDRIWPRSNGPRRARNRASFGSMVVFEQVAVRDGEFALTMPWSPPDTLRGSARDELIRTVLADPVSETRRAGPRRYTRTFRWRTISADLPRLRLVHPDSTGRRISIARLDAEESNPPFSFRNLEGEVNWIGDSIWVDLPKFGLPASSGRARGLVLAKKGHAPEFHIRVDGETVGLRDVAWISPSLPTEGSGRMLLDISNSKAEPDIFEYQITQMDVRAHKSRIRGKMTWVIGGPVAVLKDVDLQADPVDFALLERFNQAPFPYPFAGTITGRMRGRGGPLDHFYIDDLQMLFRDGNVPGAVAQGRASGELDILDPANATFHGFTVALDSFDLRTPQAINADFPRLAGLLIGKATLDSSWLDVRFSNADFVHRDNGHPESRFTGNGRLTSGEIEMSYDVNFDAQPLSFTTMAASFPGIPLRGEFSGPLKVRGTLHDLLVEADLDGEAGRIATNVQVDAEAPRYAVKGETRLTALDPSMALGDPSLPSGELTARITTGLTLDSLANVEGPMSIALDRSTLAGVRIFVGDARLNFANGIMRLDTLHVETTATQIVASGALGLHPGRTDSLNVTARVDSLGGFRRWLVESATDTLVGGIQLDGVATGWVKDFRFDASLDGEGLLAGTSGIRLLTGSAELGGLPFKPKGTFSLAADTLHAGGFELDRVFTRAVIDSGLATTISFDATGTNGTRIDAHAQVTPSADTVRVRLDSLTLQTAGQGWALARPASFITGAPGFFVDTLLLRSVGTSMLSLTGSVPREGDADLRFALRGFPVADLAEVLQATGKQEGSLDLDAHLEGTRAKPTLQASGAITGGLIAGIRLDTLTMTARASADVLQFDAALGPRTRPVMRAEGSLPFTLGLDGGRSGMRDDGEVRATVRSDTVSLRLFDMLTARSNDDPGNFAFNLDMTGTWRSPRFEGALAVRDGNLTFEQLGDVRWQRVTADIGLVGDSIAIRRLSARSQSQSGNGSATITGWVKARDRENPSFDIAFRANQFHVYDVRNVADIDISDSLRITGTLRQATLRGALTADRAVIAIPEIATKDVISLSDFDRFGVVDTTSMLDRRLAPPARSPFIDNLIVRNVPIRMGRDVWLRSAEANINLGGALSITRAQERGRGESQLALTGSLRTVRGTYQLSVGPVSRTFEVEQGSIDWFGDPDYVFNPNLNIAALHTVRQYNKQGAQPDVRVRVNIGGTLLEPTAILSTPDSARVKQADLISYLVTGGPSFEIAGRNGNYTSTATRLVLNSLASVLGGKAGGLCDDARVSTAASEDQTRAINVDAAAAVLQGTRFNCGKQIGKQAFVRLDAGLCEVGQFVGGNSVTPSALANSIGIKIDYLLSEGYTVSAGVEPPTNAVLCSQNINARGFVPTPQQFGFDLFRAWRF